jgi:hypothetical protein
MKATGRRAAITGAIDCAPWRWFSEARNPQSARAGAVSRTARRNASAIEAMLTKLGGDPEAVVAHYTTKPMTLRGVTYKSRLQFSRAPAPLCGGRDENAVAAALRKFDDDTEAVVRCYAARSRPKAFAEA